MGILGIENRTENWKTARSFAPFFGDRRACASLANRLLKPLGKPQNIQPDEIQLELFWKGVRDYLDQNNDKNLMQQQQALIEHYQRFFGGLRKEIDDFRSQNRRSFNKLKPHNYSIIDEDKLFSNLRNTEVDIVLETSEYLFIGEAKDESGFGAISKHVLVHQLIRQYVMATIVANLIGEKRRLVSFIVGNNPEYLKNHGQVQFMQSQGWLKKENVLSWDVVKRCASDGA